MSESNSLTLAGDFAVARTSKAGKTTYRGALGVITSGNAAERKQLAGVAVGTMIANNNFRGLMREVLRVFPLSSMKSQCLDVGGVMHLIVAREGKQPDLVPIDANTANKAMAHDYARALLAKATSNGKVIKGEKALYLDILVDMIDAETQRVAQAALAAEPSAEVVDTTSKVLTEM